MVEGTGKYDGWGGTMDYKVEFPKFLPAGTLRGAVRETVKFTTK